MEDYFRLNVEKRLFVQMPRHDDDLDLTPATRLLEKRREMLQVENGLLQQKEEFAQKMDTLAQRREDLARKEAQLKDSLNKFDKFLKENDSKRTRAIKKTIEERKLREIKETEVSTLKDSFTELQDKKDRQFKILDTNSSYQRYLEVVIENTGEYGEIKDLILRFDTLSNTNFELIERARQAQERMEKDRNLFLLSSETKNNLLLNINNNIAKLQTKLEEAQHKSTRMQSEWDSTIQNATQKTLLLGQIKMATSNLFALVKSHLENRMNNTVDTIEQLDKISQFILDLNQITGSLKGI